MKKYAKICLLFAGLFNKAIIQSGSALAPWSLSYNYKEVANELGQRLNFPGGSTLELLDFLKKQNASDLTRVGYEMRFDLVKVSEQLGEF